MSGQDLKKPVSDTSLIHTADYVAQDMTAHAPVRLTAHPEDNPLLNEATDMLLRRHMDADNPSLEAEIADWVLISPAHAKTWQEAQQFWEQLEGLGADHPVFNRERSPEAVRRKVHLLQSPAGLKRAAPWVTGLLAACVLGAIMWPDIRISMLSDYHTGAGERQVITLEDGSTVHLDARSAITVSDTGRQVNLVSGRAFFEVAPDNVVPFIVTAADMRVVDIGTAFDVSLTPETLDVSLAEGIVDVTHPQGTVRLDVPGQALSYDRRAKRVALASGVAGNVATWREGRLLIEDASINEVVAQIRPYYKGVIIVANHRLATKRVTGVFDVQMPLKALRTLTNPHEGRVTQISPWMIVVS